MAYDIEEGDWPALVIDNGSAFIQYGEAGEDEPTAIVPSVVGRARLIKSGLPGNRYKTYVGDAAQKRRDVLNISYPIHHGIVTDWEGMERIWNHVLREEMRVDTREHPILMTEPPRNPMYNRQKMSQILFEKFQVPALYVANPAILALYASGRVSGLVVDSGAGTTHVLAVSEGYCIRAATHRTSLAGREVTNYLMRLLNKKGYSFSNTAEREIVREIKERLCYVARDYEQELSSGSTKTQEYCLPDGQRISLGQETFQGMEVMFRPSLLDVHHESKQCLYKSSVTDMVRCGLQRCHPDIRQDLYRNIILSGGNTMHRGFGERLESELQEREPHRFSVTSPPERRSSVWIGGSILASLSNYRQMWITKEAYEEYGPSVVHRDAFVIFDPERGEFIEEDEYR